MSDVTAVAAPAAPEAPAIDTTPPAVGAPPPAPVEEKLPTMDDTLNAAWDKIQVNGVERGDGGKFVSNKPADPPAETPELAVQPTVTPEPAAPAIEAPHSWTAEAKAQYWAKLPPEAQEYVRQRESEAHRAITSQGERLKSYEPVERILADYRDDFARHAVAPDQGIRALLEAQRMFDRDPLGAATTLLAQRGIDLQAILSGQQATPSRDPRVDQAEQRLSQIEQNIKRQQEERLQAEAARLDATVNDFKKDKTYFDAVETEMLGLIPVIRQKHPGLSEKELLQKAYDSATFANPEVRERILADQRKAADEKRKADEEKQKEELKKRAEEAAKSAKVNVKSGTPTSTPKTMDDTLQEIARRAYG